MTLKLPIVYATADPETTFGTYCTLMLMVYIPNSVFMDSVIHEFSASNQKVREMLKLKYIPYVIDGK
jgi:hypothetical protein